MARNMMLTPSQIETAKAWLHDLFVYGGLLASPKRLFSAASYGCMYGDDHWNKAKYLASAKLLCAAIKYRQCDARVFLGYEHALERIAEIYFNPDLKSTNPKYVTRKDADMLAKYIA